MRKTAGLICIVILLSLSNLRGEDVVASASQGTGLTIYDTGVSLVRERRVVRLAQGSNLVRFEEVPATMDVSSVSFSPPATVMGVQMKNLQLRNDLSSIETALRKYVNAVVTVSTSDRQYTGKLMGLSRNEGDYDAVSLLLSDGSMELIRWADVQNVNLPAGMSALYPSPVLLWQVESREAQVQNVRMNYIASGISWRAEYDMILNAGGDEAYLTGRVSLDNRSTSAFKGVGVRLVSTEQGVEASVSDSTDKDLKPTGKKYVYGEDILSISSAFDALSPVFSHTIDQRLDLASGEKKYLEYLTLERLPVTQTFVYDGVVFDRFQRNRRNDWNYGTEFRRDVDVYVGFRNEKSTGLGKPLAPGRLRLYQRTKSGAIDMLGRQYIGVVESERDAYLRLGTAKGLVGERERIGYSEVVPLHEYEETFEIRLMNNRDQDVEILVVEHLYRWSSYDIVRADTEYEIKSDDCIEFKPLVKAGGSRTVKYTVRYRW